MRYWLASLLLTLATASGAQEQVDDPTFDVRVPEPQLARQAPKLLFDEAHFNVHRADKTYRAFVDLVRNDGARVSVNHARFTSKSLSSYRLLVIAGALGAALEDETQAKRPAFTPDEIKAVKQWVARGGGLLLLTDHEPVSSASADLAKAFGVSSSGLVVLDREHRFPNFYPTNVLATPQNGLLKTHPLSCGVQNVLIFGGQSLTLPEKAIVVGIGSSARTPDDPAKPTGNAQVGAFHFGRGRVVIAGDMGMLSAQRMVDKDQSNPWGMNVPGIDNRRLVLNVVRWLAHRPTGCERH